MRIKKNSTYSEGRDLTTKQTTSRNTFHLTITAQYDLLSLFQIRTLSMSHVPPYVKKTFLRGKSVLRTRPFLQCVREYQKLPIHTTVASPPSCNFISNISRTTLRGCVAMCLRQYKTSSLGIPLSRNPS